MSIAGISRLRAGALRTVAGVLLVASCTVARPPFPAEPTPGTLFRSLREPDGSGPFPAVVLLHTCGGFGAPLSQWASLLQDRGYAAVLVSSFAPRGVVSVCGNWAVSVDAVAGDALAALNHLRGRPGIDRERIAVMGFSYGAMAALRTASARYRGRAPGFRAAVALYPACVSPRVDWPAAAQERTTNLYDDVDTPTLILIGEADTETPDVASNCRAAVERLRHLGRPIEIKLYPGARHAFDHGPTFHAEAARDAETTALRFLDRHLAAGGGRAGQAADRAGQ